MEIKFGKRNGYGSRYQFIIFNLTIEWREEESN